MMLYQLALALKALGRTGAKELDERPMVKRALKSRGGRGAARERAGDFRGGVLWAQNLQG